MKRFFVSFLAFFALGAANARYDAFVSEAESGLDYIGAETRGFAADGELGRTVYSEKVKSDYDLFIETTKYVRMGAGINLGFASTMDYELGLAEQFGFGWNLSSFIRFEMGWNHSEMRFPAHAADADSARLTLWFDLARRHVMQGDVVYRRRLVPFIGLGGVAGYAMFDGSTQIRGHSGAAYGGHAAFGLSFVFSDTNAIDLMIGYEMLYGKSFGWGADLVKNFGNAGVTLSWRSSF
ncbi:MAG: hypothetical protein LBD94_00280 [Rickettsiales bacterium]|nr:hypothetical protein [Rickettsiales bacterium]